MGDADSKVAKTLRDLAQEHGKDYVNQIWREIYKQLGGKKCGRPKGATYYTEDKMLKREVNHLLHKRCFLDGSVPPLLAAEMSGYAAIKCTVEKYKDEPRIIGASKDAAIARLYRCSENKKWRWIARTANASGKASAWASGASIAASASGKTSASASGAGRLLDKNND